MKKILLAFILISSLTVFSQKNLQGKAVYMSKSTVDMSRFDKMPEQRKKQIMARMKSFLEKTYTLSFNKTASSFKENVVLEGPGTSGSRWGRSNGQGSIYKSTKDKKMVEDVEQFSKRFLIVENMDQPKWELGTETKKIGNYTCYKATLVKEDTSVDFGSIFGRRGRTNRNNNSKKDSTKTKEEKPEKKFLLITAWYTPQIPISAGPDKYYGLPGLILEINAGRTTMLCTEISLSTEGSLEIKEPKKGKEVTRKEYTKIIKVKSEELRQRFQNRGRGGSGGRRH